MWHLETQKVYLLYHLIHWNKYIGGVWMTKSSKMFCIFFFLNYCSTNLVTWPWNAIYIHIFDKRISGECRLNVSTMFLCKPTDCNETSFLPSIGTVLGFTIQYSALQYSAVLYNTVQCFAIQCRALQYSAVICNTVQGFTIQCSALQYSAVLCNKEQGCSKQCSALQHSAV